MKKILSLLLVFGCALTLVACGGEDKEDKKDLAVYELEEKTDDYDYLEIHTIQIIFDDTSDTMGEVTIKDTYKYEITNDSFDKEELPFMSDAEFEGSKSTFQVINATGEMKKDEENLSQTTTVNLDFSDTIAEAMYELPITEKTKEFINSLKEAGYKKK